MSADSDDRILLGQAKLAQEAAAREAPGLPTIVVVSSPWRVVIARGGLTALQAAQILNRAAQICLNLEPEAGE